MGSGLPGLGFSGCWVQGFGVVRFEFTWGFQRSEVELKALELPGLGIRGLSVLGGLESFWTADLFRV